MPPYQQKGKDSVTIDSGVRKRQRSYAQTTSHPMDILSESEEGDKRGAFTVSQHLNFSNGEWRERHVVESAVIVTEPRAGEEGERDDGDSGISVTAAEERLLPRGKEEEGGSSPEYGKRESILETLIQVFIPFMIAGFGMMAAGLLLDKVQVCHYGRPCDMKYNYLPSLLPPSLPISLSPSLSFPLSLSSSPSPSLLPLAALGCLH